MGETDLMLTWPRQPSKTKAIKSYPADAADVPMTVTAQATVGAPDSNSSPRRQRHYLFLTSVRDCIKECVCEGATRETILSEWTAGGFNWV
jgi:hypothetical protein